METVVDLLLSSGWNYDRNIDISEMEKVLIENGYKVFDKAKNFLKEYGLLKIIFKNPRNNKYLDTIEINPKSVGVYSSVISAYARHCSKAMVPIASLPQQCMTICITEDGEFYGGYDDWLLKLGNNFNEALYNLITGVKIRPDMVKLDD